MSWEATTLIQMRAGGALELGGVSGGGRSKGSCSGYRLKVE